MGRMKEYVATYRMIGLYGIRVYIYIYTYICSRIRTHMWELSRGM